jgi:hypothetical protein
MSDEKLKSNPKTGRTKSRKSPLILGVTFLFYRALNFLLQNCIHIDKLAHA